MNKNEKSRIEVEIKVRIENHLMVSILCCRYIRNLKAIFPLIAGEW